MIVLKILGCIICIVIAFSVPSLIVCELVHTLKTIKEVNKEIDFVKRNSDNLERIADYFDSSESEFIGMCNDIENGFTWEELRKKYGRLVIVHFNELQQYRDSYFKYLHESE